MKKPKTSEKVAMGSQKKVSVIKKRTNKKFSILVTKALENSIKCL